jgi:ATP-dependent Clp protease adaptor protein ClpS
MEEIVIEKQSVSETDINNNNESKLIIINDDINSFDHVISSLMDICGLDIETAASVALTVHLTGSCVAKTGDDDTMQEMCMSLCLVGINAKVEC